MLVEKTRSSAEPVMLASALPMAETELPPRSTTLTFGSNGSPGLAGSGRWTSLLKNWLLAAEVVLDAELLDVGPVDEDDLGLDRELRRADVEAAHEVADAGDAAPGVGHDQRVGAGVGDDPAAVLGQDALDRLGQRAGLGVVDPDDAGLQRLERVERGERRRRVDADDPARHLLGREALGGEHRPGRPAATAGS